MTLLDVKTATITEKGQFVIPKELRTEKFSTNSKIVILSFDNHLEIRPMEDLDKIYTMYASQDSLREHWDSKEEDESWKDL